MKETKKSVRQIMSVFSRGKMGRRQTIDSGTTSRVSSVVASISSVCEFCDEEEDEDDDEDDEEERGEERGVSSREGEGVTAKERLSNSS